MNKKLEKIKSQEIALLRNFIRAQHLTKEFEEFAEISKKIDKKNKTEISLKKFK